ncbi:MAG: DsbE family thiol:disulfide interchange protein [Mangrovicoccus sp.]
MAKRSYLFLAPPLIFAGLATLFLLGMYRDNPDALPSAIAGATAPELALKPLADKPFFDRAILNEPGVKLVNFWASWCAPCRVEHPNLEKLAARGVKIYGVNYKDDPSKAMAFLQELGDPYIAIGQDETGRTGLNWGLYGVPETFVIDGKGKVILRFAGPITERVITDTLDPALADLGSPSN